MKHQLRFEDYLIEVVGFNGVPYLNAMDLARAACYESTLPVWGRGFRIEHIGRRAFVEASDACQLLNARQSKKHRERALALARLITQELLEVVPTTDWLWAKDPHQLPLLDLPEEQEEALVKVEDPACDIALLEQKLDSLYLQECSAMAISYRKKIEARDLQAEIRELKNKLDQLKDSARANLDSVSRASARRDRYPAPSHS